MKTAISSNLSPEQFARLERLSKLGDAAIDFSDAPEVTDWTGTKRGLFYSGTDDKVAVGLDPDVVAWFESKSASDEEPGSKINKALRAYMQEQIQKAV